jgi:KipI family sensor histidine kinase inhibitor
MDYSGAPIEIAFGHSHWWLRPLGDRAIRIELAEQQMSLDSSGLVHALSSALQPLFSHGGRALVPAYASLTLLLHPGADFGEAIRQIISFLSANDIPALATNTTNSIVELQLLPEPGLDAKILADAFGLSTGQLLQQFCAARYQVAQIGFRAGFPYLLGLPPALSFPRKAVPRTHVPALSVAIGGAQAGIYPAAGPGGWHIIGQIAQPLFDPNGFAERAGSPCWLAPGDQVRFVC